MASKEELAGRFLKFAAAIIELGKLLLNSYWGRHINGQLFRAGTSAGANYAEACAAKSRADFIHKLQIVLKELREAKYWLKLIRVSKLVEADNPILVFLLNESEELSNIIGRSVVTSKQKVIKVKK